MRRAGGQSAGFFSLCFLLAIAIAQCAVAAESKARATLNAMGPGINILGYDGIWNGHLNAPFRLDYFDVIRKAGFRHVRINLHAFKYLNTSNNLDPQLLSRLDAVLAAASSGGLVPVIDEHDFEDCQRDPNDCVAKTKAFWMAVSGYLAGKHPSAVFELLNEPGGDMTQQIWNDLIADLLNIIRAKNPDRTIIVAALNVDKPGQIDELKLPENDRNLIVAYHYYKPMAFTHQGAPWEREFANFKNVPWGSEAERQQITSDFDRISAWSKQHDRPIYLGEFGTYDKAPMWARSEYLSFITRAAEHRGWSWAYWQFDHDFAAFNSETGAWVMPVLEALRPAPR